MDRGPLPCGGACLLREGDVSVRRAELDDAPFVHRMLCDLEREDFAFEELCGRLRTQLADGRYTCLVAEVGGAPSGMLNLRIEVQLHHARPAAEIMELVVDASSRGRGLGSALMRCAELLARERGCEVLEVSSNRERTRAHGFYERAGMVKTHFRLTMPLERRAAPW